MPVRKVSVSDMVADQLHMVHDPFSDRTNQPKIPDGKVNDSLGLHCKDVREFRNSETAGFNNKMHMLLFAGTNTSLCVVGSDKPSGVGSRTYFLPGFTGASAVNWFGYDDGTTDFDVTDPEKYALWRVVSTGLQLKLLNPTEEDDGWWEAVRINRTLDSSKWRLSTTNDGLDDIDRQLTGTLSPDQIVQELITTNLANDPTYSTGLLRDLHRVQFELHGRLDYHDFTSRRSPMRMDGESFTNNPPGVGNDVALIAGHDDACELINNFVDNSYDMVYIRLHCRENSPSPEPAGNPSSLQGSRFHTNTVSNQEIYWPVEARENRFHTKSQTIGTGAMSVHFQGRRQMQNAATLIGP